MKTTKSLCSVVVAVTVLCFAHLSVASAQLLSNKWFGMKFSGKGFVIDAAGNTTKATFSVPIFMQFLSTATGANNNTYLIHLWSYTDFDWSNTASFTRTTTSTNNNTFFADSSITVLGLHGDSVSGYHSPSISIKTDKFGAFKSASYQGIGEIHAGSIVLNGVPNNFIGSFSLMGTTVATNSLPFVAP